MKHIITFVALLLLVIPSYCQLLIPAGDGWANNSVNVTVFRKNSLVSFGGTQFIAYYDPDGFLTLGKRGYSEDVWTLNKTQYKGNVADAHNSISIMVDGGGYLHVSWDHHGHPLRYAKSLEPFSIELGEKEPMTGNLETNVTYPEFYRMPDGDLIFMYRDGQSGRGNLVLNRYDWISRKWTQIQSNLIDGEGQRNAYWQGCVDDYGVIHLSWVWRETWDVSTNHDMCYARSKDGGKTWETSEGKEYTVPINASTAEYALKIPQNSELINQTSMTADSKGNPYIASYWREKGSDIPQYHVIYKDGKKWKNLDLGFRTVPFSLKGGGTKQIPISRPQILVKKEGKETNLILIFRDEERGAKVSMAVCDDIRKNEWRISDLTDFTVGAWEPSYDTELWRKNGLLYLFVQKAVQVDGEGKANVNPEKVCAMEVDFSVNSQQ